MDKENKPANDQASARVDPELVAGSPPQGMNAKAQETAQHDASENSLQSSPPTTVPSPRPKGCSLAIIITLVAAFITACATICAALIGIIPIPTPTPPTLTPLPMPTSPPPTSILCSINNLDWQPYSEGGLGSTINVTPVFQTDCDIKITFNLKAGGEVAIYKKLNANLLAQAQGIRFLFKGKGAANALDFKLVEQDASGQETIFFTRWCRGTSTANEEISKLIKFDDLTCRATSGTNCAAGRRKVKPELVDRIDFSFSSPTDCNNTPGQGEATIKEIQLIP